MSSDGPDHESKQNRPAEKEGDSEEKALYLQFRDTLRSLEDLIDHFEETAPEIQRKLQDAHPILQSWDEAGRQDLRTRLAAMIRSVEWLAEALAPDEPSVSEFE
jgi:hypothetical protein